MEYVVATATLVLAVVTAALAYFTFRMAQKTKDVATGTLDLARAARDQVDVAREELEHAKAEAAAALAPIVVVELESETATLIRQREGMELFFVAAKVRLANYGGHAVLDRANVTGSPAVRTRPPDVWGFLASGARMPFDVIFDVGRGDPSTEGKASVVLRTRSNRSTEWTESLYFVNVRYVLGGPTQDGGWRTEVRQPPELR